MADYTEEEVVAMGKVLDILGIDKNNMNDEIAHNYLTINTGRDGKGYAWYYDDSNNIAVEIGNTDHVVYADGTNDLFGTGIDISDDKIKAIRNLMDDELAEETNRECAPCSNADFVKAYIEKDPDFADVLQQEFNIDSLDL